MVRRMSAKQEVSSLEKNYLTDLDRLWRDQHEEIIGQLKAIFLRVVSERTTTMRAAGAGNWKAYGMAADRLNGASASIGAERLVRLCGKIENAGAGGTIEGAAILWAEIEKEVGQVRAAFAHLTAAGDRHREIVSGDASRLRVQVTARAARTA